MKQSMKNILLAMLCCIAFNHLAMANTFNVFPMRLELTEGAKIGTVTVVNNNDSPANMQVRAMKWTQGEHGRDTMENTDELTFFPKIFKVPAHGQKVVRVGYQGKPLPRELSFRLFIRELPVEEPGKMGMKMAVQISMPVFIRPVAAGKMPSPEVKGISIVDGKLVGWIQNPGLRYLMVRKLEVSGSKGGASTYRGTPNGWYVLAGVNKAFDLGLSRKECAGIDTLKINAVTSNGHWEKSFTLKPALCKKITGKGSKKEMDKSAAVHGGISASRS